MPGKEEADAALAELSRLLGDPDTPEGYSIDLPDGSAIWFAGTHDRYLEFNMSGIDLLRVNTPDDIKKSEEVLLGFLKALVLGGAACAYVAPIRDDFIWEQVSGMDEAMSHWKPDDTLPLSIILKGTDSLCMWDATLSANVEATEVKDGIALWRDRPFAL
ncbi:hypothetical protein [Paracoccus sp. (in: a-proteobacteria)]|uniref:hypothetical protein n=1 Tax=Paracoccus sp. TaxID=267 RepID=UPI003A86AD5A